MPASLAMECTLEAGTSVSNLTQYKLFIGDDKKNTLFGVIFSFKKILKQLAKFTSRRVGKCTVVQLTVFLRSNGHSYGCLQ